MYEQYFHLKNTPFDNVPDPYYYFPLPGHEEAAKRILYAIESHKGAAMLTGEPGCGKTLLARTIIQALDREKYEIGMVNNPLLEGVELHREILYQLGINDVPDNKLDILHTLNDYLLENFKIGKDTVVFLDEAHVVKDSVIFEEIRLLLNFQLNERFLLTIILLGQPELKEKIKNLWQLDQRISIKCELKPLTEEEAIAYVSYRLKKSGAQRGIFTEEAIDVIYEKSCGVPRLINNICDLALLVGYEKKVETIGSSIINEILNL